MSARLQISVKKLLSEGCAELPVAVRAELLTLESCYADGERVCCQSPDEVALWAVLRGLMSEYEASTYLNWKAFESFVARALEEAGFATLKNVRVKTKYRTVEFDVVGHDGRRVVVVECKRWKRSGAYLSVAEEHAWKVRAASEWLSRFGKVALPVVVVLKGRAVAEGALVVPIKLFKGFLEELDVAFAEAGIELSKSR
ncbi:MAG: hypothetical protein GXO07_01320 [Crenarchaeota archaeon]|nr:hypothetical protein [Thermoproteota archaeon]